MKITIDSDFSHLPAGREAELRLSIRAALGFGLLQEERPESQRADLRLMIVLDSSLLAQKGLEVARQVVYKVLAELRFQDHIGIMACTDDLSAIFKLDRFVYAFNTVFKDKRPRFCENLAEGMLRAGTKLLRGRQDGVFCHILLVTDGKSIDAQLAGELVKTGEGFRAKHITSSVCVIGEDYDESLLMNISEKSGGCLRRFKENSKGSGILDWLISHIFSRFGQDSIIKVILADGVELIENLSDFPMTENEEGLIFEIGKMRFREGVEILLKIKTDSSFDADLHTVISVIGYHTEASRGKLERKKHSASKRIEFVNDEELKK